MGSNKNFIWQKCGVLFVNRSTFKNKSKIFTFHCNICKWDCDQLKKFSKHLDKHLEEYIQSEPDHSADDKFLATAKTEDKSEFVVQLNEDCTDVLRDQDPLEAAKLINVEQSEETGDDLMYCNKMADEESVNRQTNSEIVDINQRNETEANCIVIDDLSSEDYSSESDVDLEKESKDPKSFKCLKDANHENRDKPKKTRRVIIESILPFLIQQYKKYEILWQIDDIAFGIKGKKYEIFAQIAETLKLEQQCTISLEDVNFHINYLNDLYSKDKEQELRCQMKNVEFVPEYEHYKEMSFLSNSQGPFLCATCNEMLYRYHAYCQHMAEHNESQPYKCPLCDSTFDIYRKYLVHKKRHLGVLDYHCKICGKGYMFKNDLEWHVTSHTGVKPYLCPICGTGFRARHGYDNHVRRHEERYRHECHICKRGFNQLHALNNHVKSHLNIRDVLCKICGKGFVHSKYLKRHELIHGKEKHYKCNECGKKFFQSCGLRAHRKNHHS